MEQYNQQQAQQPQAGQVAPPPPLQPKQKKEKKKGKKTLIIVIVCIVAVVAVVGIYIGTTVFGRNEAVALLGKRDFAWADSVLQRVPDFIAQDVPQLKEFAAAGLLYDEGEYEQARQAFEKLGGFSYAPDMAQESAELHRAERVEEIFVVLRNGEVERAEEMMDERKEDVTAEEQNEMDLMRAQIYFDWEEYDTAIEIAQGLGDYPGAEDVWVECVLMAARQYEEQSDYIAAYGEAEPYMGHPEVQEYVESLYPGLYEEGQRHLRWDDYEEAKNCFGILAGENYEEAAEYLEVSDAMEASATLGNRDRAMALMPFIENEIVSSLVYGYYYEDFIEGTWRGDGYTFIFDMEDGYLSDLPGNKEGTVYYESGTLYIAGDNVYEEELIDIKIIDEDTIEIYAYDNDQTYTLTRR